MTTENQAPEGGELPEPVAWRHRTASSRWALTTDKSDADYYTKQPAWECEALNTADQLREHSASCARAARLAAIGEARAAIVALETFSEPAAKALYRALAAIEALKEKP